MEIFTSLRQLVTLVLGLFLAAAPVSAAEGNADPSYVLRPNDTIRVQVYEEPDLSGSVRILTTGQASFPLIGSVEISGLSVADAAEKIRELYAKDYLVDPKLTLTVDTYSTGFISIIGAVMTPGQVPVPVTGDLDLASAVATAGGLAPNADPNAILLNRASGASSRYSMADIQNGQAGRTTLRAGDRIVVNQSAFVGKTVTMLGEVVKNGPLAFPLNGRLDLVTAIAMAGGLTSTANAKKVTITRKGVMTTVDYNMISQSGGRPYTLLPDDVVKVERRLF